MNRADLTEAGGSVVGGKCVCEGVIVWVPLLVAKGLLVGAVPVQPMLVAVLGVDLCLRGCDLFG